MLKNSILCYKMYTFCLEGGGGIFISPPPSLPWPNEILDIYGTHSCAVFSCYDSKKSRQFDDGLTVALQRGGQVTQ